MSRILLVVHFSVAQWRGVACGKAMAREFSQSGGGRRCRFPATHTGLGARRVIGRVMPKDQ